MFGAAVINRKKGTRKSTFTKKRRLRRSKGGLSDEKEMTYNPKISVIKKLKSTLQSLSTQNSNWSLPEGSKKVCVTKRMKLAEKELAKHAPYRSDIKDITLKGLRKLRQELYFILHDENYNKVAFRVLVTIITLITASTVFYILETVPYLSKTTSQKYFWEVSELVVTILFTIEYVLRLLVVSNLCSYIIKPMNLVDLLAVLPYYVEIFFPDLPSTSLRVLRVVRLARLGRMRHLLSEYIEVMSTALSNAADEAGPMMFLMILVQVILFGSIVYAFENGHHEDGDFSSIPDTMWWALVTITTVGYGDLSPVTFLGRFLGVLCMFSGIVLMSICVIIIGGNFEQAHQTMMTDKAMMELNASPIMSRRGTKDLDSTFTRSIITTPDKKFSVKYPHDDKVEKSKTSGSSPRAATTVGRFKRHQLHLTCRTLEKSFNGLTQRVSYLEDEAKRRAKPSLGAGRQFPWLVRSDLLDSLSDDLLDKVIMYLNDNDRFILRELNISFYKAYYNQFIYNLKTIFNFKRSINLAMRDRVFPSVEVLCVTPNEVSSLALASISIHSFPNLRVFYASCRASSDGNLKWHFSKAFATLRHGGLEKLDVFLSDAPESGNSLIEIRRFPSLKKLSITFKYPSIYPLCRCHSSLQIINLTNGNLKNTINRQNFPALQKVNTKVSISSNIKA